MKIILESGQEEHPSSTAFLTAKYRNGEYQGKSFSDVKDCRKVLSFERRGRTGWTTASYDIAGDTLIEIKAKGLMHQEDYAFHRIYLSDPHAPLREEIIDLGIHKCLLKGRLSLYQDFVAEYEEKKRKDWDIE